MRQNNNVGWRNFEIEIGGPPDVSTFKSLISGAPDQAWEMGVQVGANLPEGGRITIETAEFITNGFVPAQLPENTPTDLTMPGIELNPNGISDFGEVLLEKNAQHDMTLHVHIPVEFRGNDYEVYVRQLFRGEEAGRVTRRLVPPERMPDNQV